MSSDPERATFRAYDRKAPMHRRLAAELLGTGLLVTAVVGSGIAAADLSPADPGQQLFYTSVATVLRAGGAALANLMFAVPTELATTDRDDWHLWVGELVATAGLVMLVFALARSGRTAVAAPAVGAYIGAAYWFTSSTSFANPAVTVGRMFSDSFAGIAPGSVPAFVVAQLVGGAVGLAVVRVLYPDVAAVADDVVVPHEQGILMPDRIGEPR